MKSLALFSLKIQAISFLSNRNHFSNYLAKTKLFVCEKKNLTQKWKILLSQRRGCSVLNSF